MKNYAVFSCLLIASSCWGVEKHGAQEGGGSLRKALSFRKKPQERKSLRDICFNTPSNSENEIDIMVKDLTGKMSETEKGLNVFSDVAVEEQLKLMVAIGFLDNTIHQLPNCEVSEATKKIVTYIKDMYAKIRYAHAQAGFYKKEEPKAKENQKK